MKTDQKKTLQQLYPKRVDILILIIVSSVLLFIGLNLPILTVRKLWEKNTFSIISGIMNLWKDKYYFLFLRHSPCRKIDHTLCDLVHKIKR